MENIISKLGSWYYKRQEERFKKDYKQFQNYIEKYGYEIDKKGLRNLGYIYTKEAFTVEGHEEILAKKIKKHREKKRRFQNGDFSLNSLIRPKPGHVTQTWKNMGKIMCVMMGGPFVGSAVGATLGYPSIGSLLGLTGFVYGILFYAPKVTNEGKCDVCGKNIYTNQQVNLENEKRKGIYSYVTCDECYEEKKSEHIPYEDMKWSWRKMRLVEV